MVVQTKYLQTNKNRRMVNAETDSGPHQISRQDTELLAKIFNSINSINNFSKF